MHKFFRFIGLPWRFLLRCADSVTSPLPFGLWTLNVFCQRILGINRHQPFMVHFTSRVVGDVRIGRKVWISFAVSGGCYVQGINSIEIGDDTIFAPGVKIISANHSKGSLAEYNKCERIRIGQRCWISANAVILPGVQLGDDVIVGAGAIVNKSFPSGSIIAGVPAKLIGSNCKD